MVPFGQSQGKNWATKPAQIGGVTGVTGAGDGVVGLAGHSHGKNGAVILVQNGVKVWVVGWVAGWIGAWVCAWVVAWAASVDCSVWFGSIVDDPSEIWNFVEVCKSILDIFVNEKCRQNSLSTV